MSHYQVIVDQEELESFVEWLPDLESEQCYYIELFCRKKYDREMPNSKTYNLNRRVVDKKSQVVQTIRKFEVPHGSYWLRDQEVSQDSLALYISTNPRDLRKASFKLMQTILNAVESGNALRPQSMVMTEIHRAKAKSNFIIWDVDQKEGIDLAIDYIESLIGPNALSVIETRGGYHFLVRPKLVESTTKDWYNAICGALQYDQKGDIMSPIPGCVQGAVEFYPYFLMKNGVNFGITESS